MSDTIVDESNKMSGETESLSEVSGQLNGYSAAIRDDLKNFTLR